MVIPLMVMVDTPIKRLIFEIKNQTLHNVKEAVELAQTNYVSVKSTIDQKLRVVTTIIKVHKVRVLLH